MDGRVHVLGEDPDEGRTDARGEQEEEADDPGPASGESAPREQDPETRERPEDDDGDVEDRVPGRSRGVAKVADVVDRVGDSPDNRTAPRPSPRRTRPRRARSGRPRTAPNERPGATGRTQLGGPASRLAPRHNGLFGRHLCAPTVTGVHADTAKSLCTSLGGPVSMRFASFDELTPSMDADRLLVHISSLGGATDRRAVALWRRRSNLYSGVRSASSRSNGDGS